MSDFPLKLQSGDKQESGREVPGSLLRNFLATWEWGWGDEMKQARDIRENDTVTMVLHLHLFSRDIKTQG